MPAKLKSRLPEIAAAIPVRAGAAIHAGLEPIAAAAKAAAPDRPPYGQFLKESIEVRSGEFSYGGRSRFGAVAGQYGFEAPLKASSVVEGQVGYGIWASWYAEFVEGGTSRAAPRPFLMPAMEAGKDELVAGVTAALRAL